MFTWTDNIHDSIWNHLNLFTSPANVIKLLKGEMESNREIFYDERDILDRKSRQIAYSISHAFEYFKAADTISVNTSPLLYFYGMLALAKALLVANNPNILLDDIKYHGLFIRPKNEMLKQYVEDPSQWQIDKEFALTNDGVFKELTSLIHNFTFHDNSIILYKSISSVDPELSEIYRKYYKDEPKVQYLSFKREVDDPSRDFYIIELLIKCDDKNEFENRFPEVKSYFFEDSKRWGNKGKIGYRNLKGIKSFPECFGIYSSLPGGDYFVGGLEYQHENDISKRYIAPEICDYVKMFILSNCVRYKQEFWGQTVRGETEGSIGFINLFLYNAKRRFPHFILNHLFNESFKYGSPGYLL
jgi:YaaC-like protein